MHYRLRPWSGLLFLAVALFATPVGGQSLSINKKSESEVFRPFSVADLVELPQLAAKLKDPARPLDKWLVAAVSSGTRAALASYQGPASDPGPLQTNLVEDLNALLRGPSLYEPQRFADITLRVETVALLASGAQGDDLLRLNRRLLEDAYPVGLAKTRHEFWIEAAAPLDTRYVFQASDDLLDWTDLNDEVWGHLSFQVDATAVTKRFFRLTPWTPLVPIIVVLLGDSTVSDFMGFYGTGWGRGIYDDFKPDARVVNLAWPGLSTRGFLTSEQYPKLLVLKPQFVLVQFGYADAYGCTGGQCTTTLLEYADNLKTIVRVIRGWNGIPVLITPPAPRVFGADGKVVPTFEDRSVVVKDVAAELQTHLIDLNQLSTTLLNQLGERDSAYLAMGTDAFHFSPEGAEVIAGLVVKALPGGLQRYLVR